MKTAASVSRALTLLAVVLVAVTLFMDTAEARRGGGGGSKRGGPRRDRPSPPATLSDAIAYAYPS
ncbi:hypothetical protein E2C01_023296 [Portunus trituberculatus]|uniref:Uncharacterized protein n=1 Tax=Portunus trituberculatus TaxID=210409 RepID=A0A5B7E7M6_PORTR|nr:hypothetical protein [Portunus trituberculatus]